MRGNKSIFQNCWVVVSATSSRREADRIANRLIRDQLAACVNIIAGVASVFRWKRRTCRTKECILVIKTQKKQMKALKQTLLQLHRYEMPEVIAWPIQFGHEPFLKWIVNSTKSLPAKQRKKF